MDLPGGCFHNTRSPNSRPMTSAFFPFTLSYGVFPSRATSILFIMYPVYSHSHVSTGWRTSTCTPNFSSMADFNVLRHCSTLCTALSTTPFDPLLYLRLTSLIVLAPVLIVHTSSMRNRMAGSWSDFTITSLSLSPHSFINSKTILAA